MPLKITNQPTNQRKIHFNCFFVLSLTASRNDELNLKTYPADQTILQGKDF